MCSLFRSFQRHRKDVSNFDRQFTSEKTDLTPTDKVFMMNLDQNEFAGFSFLNPEFVQHVWKDDYFGPSCILLHTHNYPRAFSNDFQKIIGIDIPFTISAIAEIMHLIIRFLLSYFSGTPTTKCLKINFQTMRTKQLCYRCCSITLSLFSYILLLDVVYNNSLLFLLLMRKAAIYDPLTY